MYNSTLVENLSVRKKNTTWQRAKYDLDIREYVFLLPYRNAARILLSTKPLHSPILPLRFRKIFVCPQTTIPPTLLQHTTHPLLHIILDNLWHQRFNPLRHIISPRLKKTTLQTQTRGWWEGYSKIYFYNSKLPQHQSAVLVCGKGKIYTFLLRLLFFLRLLSISRLQWRVA